MSENTEKTPKAKKLEQFNVDIVVGDFSTPAFKIEAKNAIIAVKKLRKVNAVIAKQLGDHIFLQSPDIDYSALSAMKLLD